MSLLTSAWCIPAIEITTPPPLGLSDKNQTDGLEIMITHPYLKKESLFPGCYLMIFKLNSKWCIFSISISLCSKVTSPSTLSALYQSDQLSTLQNHTGVKNLDSSEQGRLLHNDKTWIVFVDWKSNRYR